MALMDRRLAFPLDDHRTMPRDYAPDWARGAPEDPDRYQHRRCGEDERFEAWRERRRRERERRRA